jgi:hypothetical protein
MTPPFQVANNTQNLTQLALIPDYFAEYQDNAYSVRADTVRVSHHL